MADDVIKGMAVKIAMEDSSFSAGVANLKTQLNVIGSEFKAGISGVKDWGNNIDSLKANATALGDKINIQKQIVQSYAEQLQKSKDALQGNSEKMLDLKAKVESAKSAFDQSKTALGANAEATQKLKSEYDSLNKQYTSSESLVLKNVKSVGGYTIQLNNAKGALNGMEAELKDTAKAIETADKNQTLFGKTLDKMKPNLNEVKTALGAVGMAAGAFLKSAIDSAVKAEDSTKQLTNLLQNQGLTAEESGKKIDQFTSNITKMSAFSKGEAREGFQVLTEKGIEAGKAIENSGLLANIAAGMNGTLTDSADLLANAYNGKTKALTALGILTKEEAKNLGNAETATISMTDVQDRLNKRFSGAAQTELNTYTGQMKENTNTVNAAKTAIGNALLPVLAEFARLAAEILIPLAEFIKQHAALSGAILVIVAVVGTLIGGLSLLTTVTTAFGISMSAAIWPVTLVVAAIALLATAAFLIIKNWEPISGFFIGMWNGIKVFFVGLWDWIKGFFSKWGITILAFILPVIGIPILIIQHWDSIKAFFINLWNNIVSGIKGFGASIWNWVTVELPKIILGLLQWFNDLPENIGYALGFVIGRTIKFGIDLFTWVTTEIPKIIGSIVTFFSELPGRIWEWLVNIVTNMAKWALAMNEKVKTGVIDMFNSIRNFFVNLPGQVWDWVVNVTANIIRWFVDMKGKIDNGIRDAFNGFVQFFKDLPGSMLNIGRNIIEGLWNGISNAWGWLKDKVSGLFGGLVSGIKAGLGINSPSTVFAEMGGFLSEGMAIGIDKKSNLVGDQLSKLTAGIKKTAGALLQGISSDMSIGMKLTPAMASAGTSSQVSAKQGDTIINFNGSYSFADQKDIKYFMNQAGVLVKRRQG